MPVPPENVTFILPVPVLQLALLFVDEETTADGTATVTAALVVEQEVESITVTVYDPLVRPVKV